MSGVLASVVGVPYEIALLFPTIIATLGVTATVIALVFFAWAPHISSAWASQFGVARTVIDDGGPASAD